MALAVVDLIRTKLTLNETEKRRVYTLGGRRAREWHIGDDRDSTGRTASRLPCGARTVWEVPHWLNFVSVHSLKCWIADQTVTGERSPDGVKR